MADRTLTYPRIAPAPRPRTFRRILGTDWVLAWLFLGPAVLIITALLIYPFVDAFFLSFQTRSIGKVDGVWVGFANYVDFFTNPNSYFIRSVGTTLVITAGAIGGKFLIGMAMAVALNQDIPARNVLRGIMLLPWAVPAVVSAYAWRFLFDTTGPINGAIAQFQLFDDYIYFFNDARLALPALILVIIWSGTPFWTMNFLAAMQSISQELYEAAEIDGASVVQRFQHITMPSIQPVIFVTAMLSTIWTSANLTQIFVLTGGGPNYATTTLPLLAYLTAIPGTRLGAGAAISMMMVPLYLVLVFFLTRRMLKQE